MKNLIKVKDHPHLYRDENTGAIINCDRSSYNKRINKIKSERLNKEELNKIKSDIEEIKLLLKQVIEKSL